MSLFALIAALLLEQLKPLSMRKYLWLAVYADYFQHHFNSGQFRHGKVAWWLAVLPLLVAAVLGYWGAHSLHLSPLFDMLILYACLGFGRYSRGFTDIQQALREQRLDIAQEKLSVLRGTAPHALNAEELARVAIETLLTALHRHLFGVIVWYALFSLLGLGGAAGALLYRVALGLELHWYRPDGCDEDDRFGEYAQKMCARLQWLPIRLTAATFAIVGNFEDTVYCWRSQAHSWPDREIGILLSSAAGASGIRLGLPVAGEERPELGVADKSSDAAMQCCIRLVWRSIVFMLVMLLVLELVS